MDEVVRSLSRAPPRLPQGVGEPQDLLAVGHREAGFAQRELQVLRAGLHLVQLVLGEQDGMEARPLAELLLRLAGERPRQAHQPIPGSHPLLH
jgi:hypothetical protein